MRKPDDVKIALAVQLLESKSLLKEKELEDRFKLNKRLKFVVKPSVFSQQEIVVITVPGSPTNNTFLSVSEDICRESLNFVGLISISKT